MIPTATLLCAGLSALMAVGLAANVSVARRKHKVSLGDGGLREVERAVRAHANLIENAPLVFLLMALCELSGQTDSTTMHVVGGTFIADPHNSDSARRSPSAVS